MITVVAAVIERSDRRLLIGQRRKGNTSPLKWEFPGGKVREGESPEVALARELQEELGATPFSSVAPRPARNTRAKAPSGPSTCRPAPPRTSSLTAPRTTYRTLLIFPQGVGDSAP